MNQSTLPFKPLGQLKLINSEGQSVYTSADPNTSQEIPCLKQDIIPEEDSEAGNIPRDYLERLKGFEDQNRRILRMMQFMVKAGRTNERFLQELDHDFSAQTSHISSFQDAFLGFRKDTREWAQFMNTTLDFTQGHFSERLSLQALEIQQIKHVLEKLNSDLREMIVKGDRQTLIEATTARPATGASVNTEAQGEMRAEAQIQTNKPIEVDKLFSDGAAAMSSSQIGQLIKFLKAKRKEAVKKERLLEQEIARKESEDKVIPLNMNGSNVQIRQGDLLSMLGIPQQAPKDQRPSKDGEKSQALPRQAQASKQSTSKGKNRSNQNTGGRYQAKQSQKQATSKEKPQTFSTQKPPRHRNQAQGGPGPKSTLTMRPRPSIPADPTGWQTVYPSHWRRPPLNAVEDPWFRGPSYPGARWGQYTAPHPQYPLGY